MVRKWLRVAAALLVAGLPAAADACGLSPGFALIHSALPRPLPQGLFIAQVEIDRSTISGYQSFAGVRARVIKVIQGAAGTTAILLKPHEITSCDAPLRNGSSGFIVGIPRGVEGDVLVVEPLTADVRDGYRLPDGFSISPAYLKQRSPR
jgi:hypothetical protein